MLSVNDRLNNVQKDLSRLEQENNRIAEEANQGIATVTQETGRRLEEVQQEMLENLKTLETKYQKELKKMTIANAFSPILKNFLVGEIAAHFACAVIRRLSFLRRECLGLHPHALECIPPIFYAGGTFVSTAGAVQEMAEYKIKSLQWLKDRHVVCRVLSEIVGVSTVIGASGIVMFSLENSHLSIKWGAIAWAIVSLVKCIFHVSAVHGVEVGEKIKVFLGIGVLGIVYLNVLESLN